MGDHEIDNFISSSPSGAAATYQIFKDWPSSPWEEYVIGPRKTDDDGRQLIAIGHMSDLKIELDQHVNQTL